MNENEKILKALSLIAAELHMHNLFAIADSKGMNPDHSYASETAIPNLADHFYEYFEGGLFSPSSAIRIKGSSIETVRFPRRKP